jgi:putative CRISPR-associated protein (TIGR02619 family)
MFQHLPYHLVSTVGTSLWGHLGDLVPALGRPGSSEADVSRVRSHLREVVQALVALDPTDRRLGAELGSIHSLRTRGGIQDPPARNQLLVSDTPQGRLVGEILAGVFEGWNWPGEVNVIRNLQDDDPDRFAREGLRELACLIAQAYRESGDPSRVLINATGGYKAQIAIATLMGQAFGAPVVYKHERFDRIISLPPMPVRFDLEPLVRHMPWLEALEEAGVLEDPGDLDPILRVLIEEEVIEGQAYVALAPIGQIALERLRASEAPRLPGPATNRKPPHFREDHFPVGFREYVHRIFEREPFIEHTTSLDYSGQASIRHGDFYLRPVDEPAQEGRQAERWAIIGEYRSDFGARFRIFTTARTGSERQAILAHLKATYGKS